jgi:putative endonuclease
MYKKTLGKEGETQALLFLQKHGYRIIEKNFAGRFGEVDIVAFDGDVLCFIEVKTRTNFQCGSPGEAISRFKRQRLIKTAQYYLLCRKINPENTKMRFDVVSVFQDAQRAVHIKLFQNAIEESES